MVNTTAPAFPSFTVPAGTPVGTAMRELDLPNKGPDAIVVVQDAEGNVIGEVTSGAPSPTLGYPIAMARIDRDSAAEGTELQVDLRGRGEPFTVVPLPFYRRER